MLFLFLPLLSLLCFLLLYRLRLRDFLLPYRQTHSAENNNDEAPALLPRISILIPCHDQGEQLLHHLPVLLEQDYPDYEIIVCDEVSTDDTLHILEPLEEHYPRLRHRAIPSSTRGISYRQLSITLGMRAARGEWVVLTTADACPDSPQWLRTLAAHFQESTQVVSGYVGYKGEYCEEAPRLVFERLQYQLMNARAAKTGAAFAFYLTNVAIRRDTFLSAGGYSNSLGKRGGEGEQLAKALAEHQEKGDTTFSRITFAPTAIVRQEMSSATGRKIERRMHRDALRCGGPRLSLYIWREAAATISYYLSLLSLCAYIGLRGWQLANSLPASIVQCVQHLYCTTAGTADVWKISADVLVLLFLVAFFWLPRYLLRRSLSQIEPDAPRLHPHYYMLTQPFTHLRDKMMARFG